MGRIANLIGSAKDATWGLLQWSVGVSEDWAVENPVLAAYLWDHGKPSQVREATSSLWAYMKSRAQTDPEFLQRLYVVISEFGRDRLGVVLDPEDPFSAASLTAAISGKIGIPLTNIMDKEALKSDVLRYGASQAMARTGLTLNPADPFSKASITAAIASASGVPLTDITDKAKIRADLMEYGKAQMALEIGTKVNGKVSQLIGETGRGTMVQAIEAVNAERAGQGMKALARDQIADRMRVVDSLIVQTAAEEIASYQTKVCLWNKDLAKKGAQVMASRRYRERMKQDGWSKSWTRDGVIADNG